MRDITIIFTQTWGFRRGQKLSASDYNIERQPEIAMTTKTGNSNSTETATEGVEIPAASPEFSTALELQ